MSSVNKYEVTKDLFPKFAAAINSQGLRITGKYVLALFAQACHESGYFTNRLAQDANNVFSMKYPKTRPDTYIDAVMIYDGDQYAAYDTLERAIWDRIDLDIYNGTDKYVQDVKKYMIEVQSKGYAEDTRYVELWQGVYDEISSILGVEPDKEATGFGIVVLVLLALSLVSL